MSNDGYCATFRVKLYADDERFMPTQNHAWDAGFDLRAREFTKYTNELHGDPSTEYCYLEPQGRCLIKTGVSLELLRGWEAQIRPRSGLALKQGLTVVNSPGTIDSEYRNEIGVILLNTGDEMVRLTVGERIAQMVVKQVPFIRLIPTTDSLDDTSRGLKGFGSSGNE